MSNYIQDNRKVYNLLAKEYREKSDNKSGFEESVDRLAGTPLSFALKRFKFISALEIGPGSGEVCAYLSSKGCQTTAIDIAENILKIVGEISPKTKLINADILRYDLPSSTYKLVYCGAVIHLFKKEAAKKILKNIWKSLRPKGIIFVNTTIHQKSTEGYYIKKDYRKKLKRFRHRYTESEFKQLVQSSGFKILERLFTNQKDRNKKWVGYICEKVDSIQVEY